MKQYDVYGIGNALVDTEYRVDAAFLGRTNYPKGIMTLIEEEERQHLVKLLEKEQKYVAVKRSGGGSAANSLVVLAQLGGTAFYSCKVAADSPGDFYMKELQAVGIETNLKAGREPGVTGQCISMVTPDAERTMVSCLGVTQFLSANELDPVALAASSILYVEGYLVSSPTGFQAALEAQSIAKNNDVQVAMSLSDPLMVTNFKSQYEQLLARGIDLLFCNHEEARFLTNTDNLEDCISKLKALCCRFTLTRGEAGALAYDGKSLSNLPGLPVPSVDTTGAGDVFAGVFLHAICQGKTCAKAAAVANRAAAALVTKFGARLSQPDLLRALQAP